ncbi:hypothetical protein CCH79_00020498 [Gambusia affinis]|uniref:Uncharacterized protein n=1 Tax=Gambusia affinis TaxID=33528 RepID=A0A315UQL4_GAMAF|nr:hypothetical protein CCH79_00020498 [Gambusia affinis]
MTFGTLSADMRATHYTHDFFLTPRTAVQAMTQTLQTNGVQSLSKTWELSLYELQRTPQLRSNLMRPSQQAPLRPIGHRGVSCTTALPPPQKLSCIFTTQSPAM